MRMSLKPQTPDLMESSTSSSGSRRRTNGDKKSSSSLLRTKQQQVLRFSRRAGGTKRHPSSSSPSSYEPPTSSSSSAAKVTHKLRRKNTRTAASSSSIHKQQQAEQQQEQGRNEQKEKEEEQPPQQCILPHARTAILTSYDPLLQQQQSEPEQQDKGKSNLYSGRYPSNSNTIMEETCESSTTPVDDGQQPQHPQQQARSLVRTTALTTITTTTTATTTTSTSQQSRPWFQFTLCAKPSDILDDDQVMQFSSSSSSSDDDDDRYGGISEDPTVEESFECVFAHQLEEEGWPSLLHQQQDDTAADETNKEDDDDVAMMETVDDSLTSPATLLQSRTPSRQQQHQQQYRSRQVSLSRRTQEQRPYHAKSLVHMGTYDPVLGQLVPPSSVQPPLLSISMMQDNGVGRSTSSSWSSHRMPPSATAAASVSAPRSRLSLCPCQLGVVTPLLPPTSWPQRPIMIRPTPGSGMKILGIRFSSSQTYLWSSQEEETTTQGCMDHEDGHHHHAHAVLWHERLQMYWKTQQQQQQQRQQRDDSSLSTRPCGSNLPQRTHKNTSCSECMILPVNNGNEPKGEALVVDFESRLFCGTILVRVRGCEGTTKEPYDDSYGYFAGMNRKYQIVVRGKFREASLPLTQCVVGIQLERPVGNLPPKWIMNGALKVLSFFAPQLKAVSEGDRPYSVSPFGSTPQTLRLDDVAACNESMEEMLHEPIHDHHTLLGKASKHRSSLHRARFRKRNFDKLHVAESSTPATLPDKIYTFEFLQHLLNMQEWTIELGNMLGHVELKDILDGQPMQIMARHGNDDDRRIWSFDLWHECLIEDSKKYDPVLEE